MRSIPQWRSDNANERKHELATLEHLLLALLDEPDAAQGDEGLCGVELDRRSESTLRRRSSMTNWMPLIVTDIEGSEAVAHYAAFQRVIQRAAIHVQSSGRSEVTGANVLVAIFAERESRTLHTSCRSRT